MTYVEQIAGADPDEFQSDFVDIDAHGDWACFWAWRESKAGRGFPSAMLQFSVRGR